MSTVLSVRSERACSEHVEGSKYERIVQCATTNPPFTFRQAQGERLCARSSISQDLKGQRHALQFNATTLGLVPRLGGSVNKQNLHRSSPRLAAFSNQPARVRFTSYRRPLHNPHIQAGALPLLGERVGVRASSCYDGPLRWAVSRHIRAESVCIWRDFRRSTLTPVSSTGQALALSRRGRGNYFATA